MMLVRLVFLALALVILGSALKVVTSRNILHSALFMVLAFIGVAGMYVLLEAPFIAGVQVLIYVGAIAVLILFAIMLTRGLMSREVGQTGSQWPVAALVAVLLAAVLIFLVVSTEWRLGAQGGMEGSVAALGQSLLTSYVLPFEVAGVLLLVAMIGAIIIARE